ncbi:MAG: MDR/SDR family oxidoreductase, partial [Pseudonocardiaceae bacterium]
MVVEVGAGVTNVVVGDCVMGIVAGGLGPVVVADARLVVRVPAGWSWEAAAGVPVGFLTAWYGLVGLGRVQAGELVLVHAAAGGVGLAAVQIARWLGARVLGTASAGKQGVVCEWGVAPGDVFSSRSLDFEDGVLAVTGGCGVDVVLDSLAGVFVDASLRLVAAGGRFVEMGKTDIRDADEVAKAYPGVWYRAFDLISLELDEIQRMLAELVPLFECGVLRPLPVTTWDIRRAPEAMRFVSQARHIGKVVLRMPRLLSPDGAVVVTGGTGTLGGIVSRHLVAEHGVRRLLLVSRSGMGASGAAELVGELTALGAQVDVVACDVSDRDALKSVLSEVPVTGVVHTAGVLDDGLVSSLSAEQVERVLVAKAVAAWHLHELTRDLDLSMFVLFSSAAATFGNAGQGNYAAANAILDALAQHRHVRGLPAVSLGWGLWEETSTMTAGMTGTDHARMTRAGVKPLSTEDALALLDKVLAAPMPHALPIPAPAPEPGTEAPALLR